MKISICKLILINGEQVTNMRLCNYIFKYQRVTIKFIQYVVVNKDMSKQPCSFNHNQ